MSLLVTAFGRFEDGPNCSETLLDALERDRAGLAALWGGPVAFVRLDVDTEAVRGALADAIAAARPSHVLLLGQAAGRAGLWLERRAFNDRDLGAPDCRGRTGPLGPVTPGGPHMRGSTWPDLEAAARAMRISGVEAGVSDDAGRHLCNQSLYLALETAGRSAPPFVAAFLHLPLLPEQVAAGIPAAARAPDAAAPALVDVARAVRAFLGHTRRGDSEGSSGMRLPRRRWAEMTTKHFASPDVGSWIAVLPIAAVEQHGPHLPTGTDVMIGEGYLARAEALIPDTLPVTFLPTQTIGVSGEHAAFPGTLSLSPESAIRAWTEIGASVGRAGVRKLVLVNSHGGNSAVIDIVAQSLRARGMLAIVTSWARLGYPDGLFDADEIRHGVHAGGVETSLMWAFRPELVAMDEARDFRPATYAMEQEFAMLRAGRPAGFAWRAQDLHPSGAIGDAGGASEAAGEQAAAFAASAFVALLEDVARFPLERLAAGPLDG